MGFLRKTFKKTKGRARKQASKYLSKLEINFPQYNLDISSKIPDTINLGDNPEKGIRGEQINLSGLKGKAISELKKRLDIEAILRKKFQEKITTIKQNAPEYLATHLLGITKDYNSLKNRLESAKEKISSIKNQILKILVVVNTIKTALNILNTIAEKIHNIFNPIEKILQIAEKLLNAPIFTGEPGTLRTKLFAKIDRLKGKITSTKKDIDNYLHPKQIEYINTKFAKILSYVDYILDDLNFLLEKIAILLALLEYLFLIILKLIAIRSHESDSELGGGNDGTVIKDTIESASTVDELTDILNDINPPSGGKLTKVVEHMKTIKGTTVQYKTKIGKPGITTVIDKLISNPQGGGNNSY